jgi:SAM-dependent methyltransferase
MTEYWESKFKNEGALWKFEPSDSALFAADLFKSAGIKNILIPGFGYGRNAKLFSDSGFDVAGIEISESAIKLARESGLKGIIHHGSVVSMPFDKTIYDGIFCYALIHLLNKPQRRIFLKSCLNQLKPGGLMIFTVISKQSDIFGTGRVLSKNRYRIPNGIAVYFYDQESVEQEFLDFGLIEFRNFDEPVKFMSGQEPVKCLLVICRKEI